MKFTPQLKDFNHEHFNALRDIYLNFSSEDAIAIKEIETVNNHDVKAVEYALKINWISQTCKFKEFIHFGLTSQDINNTAILVSKKHTGRDTETESLVTKLKIGYRMGCRFCCTNPR